MIVNRLEFTSKTLKRVVKKIQAFKIGLPNEGFIVDEDFNQAEKASTQELADLKKTLKSEADKLSPQAILHMLKALVLRDSAIWSSGSSDQILPLIKLAVKYFLLTPHNLEEFFGLVISQMNKIDVGDEFQLDVYEEMTQLQNLCPANAYIAYAEYLINVN